jgi:hypothetical protein
VVAFDLASRQAAIVLAGPAVAAPTVVVVPHRVHFAGRGGFEVRATAERAPEWDAERGRLAWWPRPSDARHALVIAPAGRFDAAALPPAVRPLLARMARWVFRPD